MSIIAAIVSVLCMLFLAAASGQDSVPSYYNVKAGPVRFTLSSGLSVEYLDNVNLSNGVVSPRQSEVIVSPNIGLLASTQAELGSHTQMETLRLSMSLGYSEYLMHPELNQNPLTVTIAPDSTLGFLVRAGHVNIRFTDGFSLQQDPSSDGTLSNVALFKRFTNTAGVNAQWDMNSKTSLSLGYSHSNLVALSLVSLSGSSLQNPGSLDSSSDSVSVSAVSKVLSILSVGFGASATSTNVPANPGQDTTSCSYGPFMSAILTQYTTLQASCGASESRTGGFFDDNGFGNTGGSDSTTTNFSLSVVNRLNRYYDQTFTVGRTNQLDILGQQTIVDSITYASTWRMNSVFTLGSTVFAENTAYLGSSFASSAYKRYGCSLGTGCRLSRKLSASIAYRYTNKIADNSLQSYMLNSVTLSFSYAF